MTTLPTLIRSLAAPRMPALRRWASRVLARAVLAAVTLAVVGRAQVGPPAAPDPVGQDPGRPLFADPVEARKMFIARQPMGRLAKAEEIAPVVVFLASDESAFVTGNCYSVDGGMTI